MLSKTLWFRFTQTIAESPDRLNWKQENRRCGVSRDYVRIRHIKICVNSGKRCCCVLSCSVSHVRLFVTPMDYNPPLSYVHGILQASILEWVAMPFSRGCSQPRNGTWVSWIASGCFTRLNKHVYLDSTLRDSKGNVWSLCVQKGSSN